MKHLLLVSMAISGIIFAEDTIKSGLTQDDWKYTLPPGVTTREVTYYSDGTACYGKIFFPKGFSAQGKTPGVVLGQGWAGSHFSIEKYGAKFADRGLVAMVIDYRGWGMSDGFASVVGPDRVGGDYQRDEVRFTKTKADVTIKRTRLLPLKQVEDYRNAISFLQGEPGVNPERIGVWGSSYAGGHSLVVAALDARVKAVAVQVPGIAGQNSHPTPFRLDGKLLEDAMKRARTGQGAEYETGFSARRMVDVETQQAIAEYRPMNYVEHIGPRPVLFIVAQHDQLINNENAARGLQHFAWAERLHRDSNDYTF